jgi:membrane protein
LSQDQGRDQVTNAIRDARSQSGAIGFFGLIGLAWSGTAVFGVLRSALNAIFDVRSPRPPLIQKLIDLGTVLSFAPLFLASIAATGTLRLARRASEDSWLGEWPRALGFGWSLAAVLLPLAISCIAFFLVYWLVPTQRRQPRHILPGAILAAVLFEGVKISFNIYIENFSNYDVVFGSLGAVVALLFWVYVSANILLFGAEVIEKLPAVAGGAFDERPAHTTPRLPLAQRSLHLLRGLVIRPEHDKEQATRDQP